MLTSLSNPKVKLIRKLKNRKERENTGLFYLEGLRIVGEAFQEGFPLEELIFAPDLLTSEFGLRLIEKAPEFDIPVLEVSKIVFEKISGKERPQGIAALGRQRWFEFDDCFDQEELFWVALDSAADPGNIGTILRTADAVGAEGVILLDDSADPYSPNAVRASMGALFTQKLIKADYEGFADKMKQYAAMVVGTSDKAAHDYQGYNYPDKLVILMGSERQGLHEQYYQLCDEVVSIPMSGKSDSLNLAVATAVVLYEVHNQKRKKGE